MPKRTSDADNRQATETAARRRGAAQAIPLRVTIITLDSHLAGATERAAAALSRELPGLALTFHAATDWADDPASLERCRADIERADIIVAAMLFIEEHINAVLPWLEARRADCDALIACMSAGEVIRLTRMGRFSMDGSQGSALSLLKRLRGAKRPGASSGRQQLAMLRRLPQFLRFIPGTAQDVRAYFLSMQYWLAASEANVANLVRFLVDRYAAGPREPLRGSLKPEKPASYPEVGLYHPRLKDRMCERASQLPAPKGKTKSGATIGLLVMRPYVLAGDTAHYDAVIASLEARGHRVIAAFATGLDSRPAVERYFLGERGASIDVLVSLTGFSLVGGPAYNDASAAEELLARLDVPYIAAQALEFQSLEDWEASARGLLPIEATMMVAIPELDGATGAMVYGGRSAEGGGDGRGHSAMRAHPERIEALAERVGRLVALRKTPPAERRVGIVLFNFPPNGGAAGTAAHLSVFESLLRTLRALEAVGYDCQAPADVEELRRLVLEGNAARFGSEANVAVRIEAGDHVRREPHLAEIEAQWGPAPGRQQTDGASLFVLGHQFGKVFVGLQPAFGYEGDPMRLLFESGFAPTHAFSAFYRWLREDFGAHALLHFGTHGALEFMPGKQAGLSAACWPDRLMGNLPNLYLYAANNPSEGTLAKRRSAATLVSYMTPPLARAELYRELADLKASIGRWRALPPESTEEREALSELIQTQAAGLELVEAAPLWNGSSEGCIGRLAERMAELETTLIPYSLHVLGEAPAEEERIDMLLALAEAALEESKGEETEGSKKLPTRESLQALIAGKHLDKVMLASGLPRDERTWALLQRLADAERHMREDHETPALLHALEGGFIRPAPGGDLLSNPAVLPTGRNLHGFDPFRLPSAFAVAEGARQAALLLARHDAEGGTLPETVAMVLWGSDTMKSEGAPLGQALALMGAKPRFDSFGRLAGASLIPLEELGRPRIDVLATLSGIFRDLLPLQTRMLAEAAFLAADADEPDERNFIRKHALAYQAEKGCDLETAALRVFSNADGAYGSNVNQMVDSGCWQDEDELAEAYSRRKCFAYGRKGGPQRQPELLGEVLSSVELAYQNLESVELGVTTVDHYFDTLGGIGRAVRRASGQEIPVYIGDQTQGQAKVRTLSEQVELETRTRVLNPKWYEGMLKHGGEGVRQIEAQVTNTMGWSATTGQVDPWVYQRITETFVLDPEMRERLAALNPKASAKVANRLLEAHERAYWTPEPSVLEALRRAGEELEDRLEGVIEPAGEDVAA